MTIVKLAKPHRNPKPEKYFCQDIFLSNFRLLTMTSFALPKIIPELLTGFYLFISHFL